MSDRSFFIKNRLLKYTILLGLIAFSFVYGIKETNPIFSFGIISDVQYCECAPAGTRFYSKSLKKLAEAIIDFNNRNMSFVIQLGDLIDKDFESYGPVLSLFNKIEATKYHVLGNHDYNVDKEKKQKVPEMLGLDSHYYEFESNGWRMIILDGNDLSFYAPANLHNQIDETNNLFKTKRDQEAVNAHYYNGGLGSQQISWLENILKQSSLSEEKIILFCHFPVYPSREENLWNDIELINLLESYPCIVAFFSGHYHPGSYAKKKGIHYLSFQGMVETEDRNAYSIVEVYSDHLKVLGYGREPSRILTFKADYIKYEK